MNDLISCECQLGNDAGNCCTHYPFCIRIKELETTLKDYINNASGRAVDQFDYDGGKYANTGDTFNLLITEKSEMLTKIKELEDEAQLSNIAFDEAQAKLEKLQAVVDNIHLNLNHEKLTIGQMEFTIKIIRSIVKQHATKEDN